MKIRDVRMAVVAYVEAMRDEVESDEVVLARARECKSCPARRKSVLAGVVAKALERSPKEMRGYVCGVCLCPLGLLIPAKNPHIDSEKERKAREKINPRCWNL